MTEPTTPEDIQALKARARAERRARQTVPNLVGSLIASLAIVLALVAVVARPDQPTLRQVDYRQVALELSDDVPGTIVAPALDDTWWSNRADLRTKDGIPVWTVGLVSSSGDFVQIVQGFGPSDSTASLLPAEGSTGEEILPGPNGGSGTWLSYDLTEAPEPGNTPYLLASEVSGAVVVIGGSSEATTLFIAATLQAQYPEMFGMTP